MARGRNKGMKTKSNDNGRKTKKKISPLSSDKVLYVDYKDVDLLNKFKSDRAKIKTRRVTGNDVQQQREIARAIKNAREMGLLPYASRITTRGRGGNRNRDDRRGGGDNRSEQRDSKPAAEATAEATTEASEVSTEAVEASTEAVAEVEASATTETQAVEQS